MDITLISIRHEGKLCYLESERDFPFLIKRVYYTHSEAKGMQRGMHGHKTLRQVLICVYGKINVILDNGFERREVLLDSPEKGLIVDAGLWHDMIWMEDNSVLCVLASDYYDESDYIRDYDEFVEYVRQTHGESKQ